MCGTFAEVYSYGSCQTLSVAVVRWGIPWAQPEARNSYEINGPYGTWTTLHASLYFFLFDSTMSARPAHAGLGSAAWSRAWTA